MKRLLTFCLLLVTLFISSPVQGWEIYNNDATGLGGGGGSPFDNITVTGVAVINKITGGSGSVNSSTSGFVGGGLNNTSSGPRSGVMCGDNNQATTAESSVICGEDNNAMEIQSFIGNGTNNTISGSGARGTILNGVNNYVGADVGIILNGKEQTILGDFGVLMGQYGYLGSAADRSFGDIYADSQVTVSVPNAHIIYGGTGYEKKLGVQTLAPNSTLHVEGTAAFAFDSITSNVTLNGHFMMACDASEGDINITLPSASGITGRMYYVKKIDGTHNTCNMITNSTETIDGLDDGIILADPYISVGFVSDGTNWHTFIRRASGGSVAPTLSNYSVIGTFTDWTSVSRLAKKDGDYLRIQETAANPAFQAWWTFPGIHAPSEVIFEGCIYDGADNDDVEAIIFSNASSAWHDLRINAVDANPSESDFQHTPYIDEGAPHDRHYAVPSPPGDYVDSSGNVLVGVKHTEAGSTTHDWYCDAIHVKDY